MKHEVKEVGPCKLAINVELESDKVKETIAGKYRDLADRVALPGFRRGHIPHKILEKRYGKELMEEAKRDLVESSYREVLEERKLSALGEPEIELDKITLENDKPLAFEIKVEVKPSFEVKDYKGIKAERKQPRVTDADVQRGLDRLREAKGEIEPIEGTAQDDDLLIVDQELLVDGASVVKNENLPVAVSKDIAIFGKPHPELYLLLAGAKAGEVRECAVKIPESFDKPDFRNKEGVVRLTIHEIKRRRLPELTEQFAKDMDFDSLDALTAAVRKRLADEKEEAANAAVEEQILEHLLKATPFQLPEGLILRGVDSLMKREQVHMEVQGLPEDKVKARLEELARASTEYVVSTLRVHFLLDEIAKKERIFATENEVEERIGRIAQSTGRWPTEVRKHYEENDLMGQLRTDIKYDKAKALLRSQAVIQEISE
ncbi:MAG: trigger factor [Planctomycetes bacterium]|nr:trigger factor [Planctomycetota bacterium]